jgi:FtsZ-interacting cell division protein ZipA
MEAWQIVLIIAAAAVIVLAVLGIWLNSRRRRSSELRDRFGPEYQRTVREQGDRSRAERVLVERKERVEKLHIEPLSAEDRDRYVDHWERAQALFVDDPSRAVGEADDLIQQVMGRRGYPVTDFEQRAEDISVDHPDVVSNYREAHAIHLRNETGEAVTEDLRRAFVHYRELFAELLETDEHPSARVREESAPQSRERDVERRR